jgi:hypothetical protein
MSIIGILVIVIVACLIWWAIVSLMAAFGLGDPVATVVKVLLVVLFCLWLINALGGLGLGLKLR